MMRSTAAALSVFALVGCAHEKVLEPASGVSLAPGREDVAEVAAAGVTLEVTGDSWKGDPQDLGRLFTPVRVTIQNHSGKPLRVSYGDISLAGASGFHYAAIPPIQASGVLSAREAPASPALRQAGWENDGFDDPWPEPFSDGPLYDDTFYSNWPERLPTEDMLSEALPEGVVQDGGSVSGFVYFQSVTGREPGVQFEMILADASDGQTFGRIAIPFQTMRR
jgi:hypothetical protein